MTPAALLALFIVLTLVREAVENALAATNRRHFLDPRRQQEAQRALNISADDLARAVAYADDRHCFGLFAGWVRLLAGLAFLVAHGFGWLEGVARGLAGQIGLGSVATGLIFFGALGVGGALLGLPFDYWATFRIEAKHGFNRQTRRGFFTDWLKTLALTGVMGGALLAGVLTIMESAGAHWWLYAWGAVAAFNSLTLWIYPRVLAPVFNRFTPLPEGELRSEICALAERVGFRTTGIFVMDASRRSSHGNAYFTGLFREKRIVVFDTLLDSLTPRQVVAVLAHELGHFKLHHVRWSLLRGIALTGAIFFALAGCLGLTSLFTAFGLAGPTAYGGLLVVGAWLELAGFVLQPVMNAMSRRNERAADRFALAHCGTPDDLAGALLKLRERSHLMPLRHPLYSRVYDSHPPLIERLQAIRAGEDREAARA